MLNSIDFYKGIFLHVIPVRIIVPWIEEKTLKRLAKGHNIIVPNADKGDAIVVIGNENKNKGAIHNYNYKMLQTKPTLQQIKMVNDRRNRFKTKNLLHQRTAE